MYRQLFKIMEEELQFLLEGDENILEAEIGDVVDKKGKASVGISLTVGMSEKNIEEAVKIIGIENIQKITTGFEIILTKSDLKKINKLIKEYEGY